MITADEARKIAQNEINNLAPKELPAVIIKTIEFDEGWLFLWDSKKSVETGNILDRFLGNIPIIVEKCYGMIYRVWATDWNEKLGTPEFCSELLRRYKNGNLE